jgi:outer membrane immunogenic protein
MKRLASIFVCLVATAAFGRAVQAADLPAAPVYQPAAAPATVAVPVYNWSGIYVGLNGGYGFGQSSPMSLYSSSFSAFDYSSNGWLGGLTAGAQIQSGHTVLGLEGDIDWTNAGGSGRGNILFNGATRGQATLSSSLSWISTLRTRVGYAVDNVLIYGTGGVAVTNETSTLTGAVGFVCGDGAPNDPPCSSLSNLHLGLSAGGGIEYGITPNLSTKLEYVWIGAGALNTLKVNTVRAGLNWRFGM